MPSTLSPNELQQLDQCIWLALAEDGVEGDVTSDGLFGYEKFEATATLKAHMEGVAAGLDSAARVFQLIDGNNDIKQLKQDGDRVQPGDIVLQIRGTARNLLLAERVALNFLTHLSGIATLTRSYVDAIGELKTQILDTRKTLPGLRSLQKAAVRAGGGCNHRMSLSDMAMIKDNHVMLCRDKFQDENFQTWVQRIKKHKDVAVVLEIDSPDQLSDAKASGADIIMLDNFTTEQMREAVAFMTSSGIELEASGNVTLDTVAEIAGTGVNRISIGRLTHSAPALDFSMDISL